MVGKIGLFQHIPQQAVNRPVTSNVIALSAGAPVLHDQTVHSTTLDPKIAIGGLIALGFGAATVLVTRKIKAGKVLSELRFKEQISNVYDAGWERMIADAGEQVGSMKKPELHFDLNNNASKDITTTRYNSSENKTHINLDFFKTHNYFVYAEKGGEIRVPDMGGVCLYSKDEIEIMRANGCIDDTFKVKKATKEEVLFAIESGLWHEQRHSAQIHTVLNDFTLGPEKMVAILAKDYMNKGMSAEKAMEKAIEDAPYWVNYAKGELIPNRSLTTKIPYRDTNLKISGQTIADSVEAYSGAVANDSYCLNLLELDANAWTHHCLSQVKELPAGCSREFFEGIKASYARVEQQAKEFLSRATLI